MDVRPGVVKKETLSRCFVNVNQREWMTKSTSWALYLKINQINCIKLYRRLCVCVCGMCVFGLKYKSSFFNASGGGATWKRKDDCAEKLLRQNHRLVERPIVSDQNTTLACWGGFALRIPASGRFWASFWKSPPRVLQQFNSEDVGRLESDQCRDSFGWDFHSQFSTELESKI